MAMLKRQLSEEPRQVKALPRCADNQPKTQPQLRETVQGHFEGPATNSYSRPVSDGMDDPSHEASNILAKLGSGLTVVGRGEKKTRIETRRRKQEQKNRSQ